MLSINIKIKEEHQSTIVGFGDSGLPLGKRTEQELVALAEMAQYDSLLASFFEVLPTPAEITEYKEQLFLETHPVVQPEQSAQPAASVAPEGTEEEHTGDETHEG